MLVAVLLAVAALACGLGGESPDFEATSQALSASILSTSTAAAAGNLDPTALISTAQAQATALIQGAEATRAALSDQSSQAQTATAVAFSPIQAELPKYGVDPNQGKPGWIHPPLTLDVEGYMQYDYANQFLGTVAKDFVVSADITWNTTTGISGCGFVMRSDGNQQDPSQYLTVATRGASGHVVFGTMAQGELVTWHDIYAYGIDPNFDWQNDTTNRLTVVGHGDRFTIYTNDTLLGEVDPSQPPPQPRLPAPPVEPSDKEGKEAMAAYQVAREEYQQVVADIQATYRKRLDTFKTAETKFDRGFIAMLALSESGKTHCEFNNAWLWLINE